MALNLDSLGLAATVTATGISAPDYQTILTTITGYFQQIYGSDAYLEPDSKDGQMIALVALAINDANNMAIAVYNAFSPATAQGNGLASVVKINGIIQQVATNSTVDVQLNGAAGTTITNGSVKDNNGVIWDLPATTTIGTDGTVTVTATSETTGAIAALPGTVTQINTPTLGWTSVTNASAAAIGSAAETDTELRARQTISTTLASTTPLDAIDGAIAGLSGVSRYVLFENDTGAVDANGLPAHSISAVIEGGDVNEIAQTLYSRKGQGVSSNGTTSITIADVYGNPHVIQFSRPVDVPIYIAITMTAFIGYTTAIGNQIKTAIADYINSLSIGADVLLSRVYSPANLGVVSGGNSQYYDIMNLQIGRVSTALSTANITIAWNESPTCDVSNINLTVSS
jgi:uncharacterized phage protein gp47/JayE